MKLYELLDIDLLQVHMDAGYVRRQVHPSLPLAIYNYTDTCAFDRAWTAVTKVCRGLIVDTRTDEVVARPYQKFMNYGEPGSPVIPLDAGVDVTDKLDGSLGILYPVGGGRYAIATRGSFLSEQAIHATKVWEDRYASRFTPSPGVTYLFEIVYPDNRIVCNYGDTDDLFLLGAVDIRYGCSYGPLETEVFGAWPGPRTQTFSYSTLADALAAPPRVGAEGLVVRRWHSEDRIKIKQDDYVQLHRIITGCTARRLWEALAVHACVKVAPEGKEREFLVRRVMLSPDRVEQVLAAGEDWQERYLVGTPEEFRDWVQLRIYAFNMAMASRRLELKEELDRTLGALGLELGAELSREDRKRFAMSVVGSPNRELLFCLSQGREIESALWRELRPEHELPYRVVDESVA